MRVNTCPECKNEVEHKGENSFRQDIFRCNSGCGIEFRETGLGPKLEPAEFEVGMTYRHTCWKSGVATIMEIEILDRAGCFATVRVNDMFNDLVAILPDVDTEYMLFHVSWPCHSDKIYPYGVVSSKSIN